jgi:DNA repair protein RadA/Sms
MRYICSSCGSESLKWSGKCPFCDEWGTLEENKEEVVKQKKGPVVMANYSPINKFSSKSSSKRGGEGRISTGYKEFDRVLGKGLVQGEVVLLSGEPGVGKSTLLMQIVLNFAKNGKVLYVCGEESPMQLKSRLNRLEPDRLKKNMEDNFVLTEDTGVENIAELIKSDNFDLVVIDSVQSMTSLSSKGYPGSISQVRVSGSVLTRVSKSTGTPMFIVGQINKGGDIAGPKVLEHIVDCVLYMEGDQYNQYRIMRSIKNRFGSTNEIGVFEMRGDGLKEVGNPSLVFLESGSKSSGSAIGAIIQGSRVVFVEVQALVVERESEGGPLRRVANGIKKPRLDMLCAVMSRKGGVFLGNKDVFVNVVGGLSVSDPALDLAICAAIKSSVNDEALSKSKIYFGEVGLTGEVRGTWGVESVIAEAKRAGYEELVVGRMRVGAVGKLKVKKVYKIKSI